MSRFGSTMAIVWNAGDTFTGGTTISLEEQDMPQYPFEESRETDIVQYRSLSGEIYQYQNYNKNVYTFNWSNLRESKKEDLVLMADSLPAFSVESGGTTLGTFRMVPNSFSASEVLYELYDVSFAAESL